MLSQTAWEIEDRDRKFQCQKTLMTGGTCEASIYQLYGYKTGAICYPLGNYHNMGRRFLSEEFVNSKDLMNGIWLLHDAAIRLPALMGSGEVYGWLKDRFSRDLDEKMDKLLKNPLPMDKITEEEVSEMKVEPTESVPIAYGDEEMGAGEDRFVEDTGEDFGEE
jgi:hypothetical protein